MDIKAIVVEVSRLARWAAGAVEANRPHKAKASLVELRQLLNAQPELEATEAPKKSRMSDSSEH